MEIACRWKEPPLLQALISCRVKHLSCLSWSPPWKAERQWLPFPLQSSHKEQSRLIRQNANIFQSSHYIIQREFRSFFKFLFKLFITQIFEIFKLLSRVVKRECWWRALCARLKDREGGCARGGRRRGTPLPQEPSKTSFCMLYFPKLGVFSFWDQDFTKWDFFFPNVVLKEQPLTKHKQTREDAEVSSCSKLKSRSLAKPRGCYYLDAAAAGSNSERRMIHYHGYWCQKYYLLQSAHTKIL